MNSQNPATIIRGPAIVTFKDEVFYLAANLQVTARVTTFDIPTSAYGVVEQREATALIEITGKPAGKISQALNALYPHRSYIPGQLVHLTKTLGAIDLATDVVTCVAHDFRDGHAVRVASFGVLPTGLAAATLYYLHKLTADTFTLHLTKADALAGTSTVDITGAGSGTHRIIEQEPLVIQSMVDGKTTTFHNACVTKMPDIDAAATRTAIGDVTITCYRKHGSAPEDANAIYTEAAGVFSDASFDPADITTEPYDLQWGAVAPWDHMATKDGTKVAFNLSVSEVLDDVVGIVSHQIDSLEVTATARPNGVDESAVLAKRTLQGAGAGRGRRITGDDLDLVGTELYVRLYAAGITEAPLNFDGKEDRVGDITWRANRGFTGGATTPLFYIGAAAPA